LKKAPPDPPAPHLHLEDLAMNESDEHLALRKGTKMHSLQREGRTALLEMPLPKLLTDRRSCHRRRAVRTTRKRTYQIWPMGSSSLLQEATRAITWRAFIIH
jgi:hypothetical protein